MSLNLTRIAKPKETKMLVIECYGMETLNVDDVMCVYISKGYCGRHCTCVFLTVDVATVPKIFGIGYTTL